MRNRGTRGFTIVELLVVVSIIAMLIGILLPAVGKARDQARLTASLTNMRQLAIAHANYGAEWGDAQCSLTSYSLPRYGSTPAQALSGYEASNGSAHPGIELGWGHDASGDNFGIWGFYFEGGANAGMIQPIDFNTGFGWFRVPNGQAFNEYLSGRFYDPVFYAPKDKVVTTVLEPWLSSPDEYVPSQVTGSFIWSSYCLSPAALFAPTVMANPTVQHADGTTSFRDPFASAGGTRTPALSQARYPDLKTHMIEHHWLQRTRMECNANFSPGTYDGCEPYYFCHSVESTPVTLFYDGHVAPVGVESAVQADRRNLSQAGYGLWHRGTPLGTSGYFGQEAYDFRADNASFHILTTDGILGRDVSGGQ